MTLLLDIAPEDGLARTRTRAGQDEQDRFDTEKLSFHEAVRSGFLALAEVNPKRIAVIDAAADVEQVHQQILEAIRERLDIL